MLQERITARKNPLIQQVRKLLSSRKEREEAGLFVSDGVKLLAEAVKWWDGLETVILSDGVDATIPDGVRVVRVPAEIMTYISPMRTPQGALFMCRLPKPIPYEPHRGMLILDGIQDPGNLGTILRTADAMEVPVVLLEGCADPYSHKVVRASMGAVFRTKPVQATWEQVHNSCREAGIPIGVTALTDRAKDMRDVRLGDLAVVIGSEGQGVRPEIMKSADQTLVIPMNPKCESLNAAVAATICMWEMKR